MTEFGDTRLPQNFWSKVEPDPSPNGCWIWTASRVYGYGHFGVAGVVQSAHRLAYERLVGPIPDGLQIDHLCRNRACVNPAHLEPVTQQENIRRGLLFRTQSDHCRRGHPYDEANTYHTPTGVRTCRACNAIAVAKYRQRCEVAA